MRKKHKITVWHPVRAFSSEILASSNFRPTFDVQTAERTAPDQDCSHKAGRKSDTVARSAARVPMRQGQGVAPTLCDWTGEPTCHLSGRYSTVTLR